MKRVILIGDSIRMGYQSFVIELLEGRAAVWGPEPNGGDSANVLANLDAWVLQREADLVCVNAGLHDIKRAFDSPDHQVPPEAYRANVETIMRRVTESGKRLLWILTTPVHYERHHARKGFDRFEEDVRSCNDAVREIAGRIGVPVKDLYRVVMDAGRDDLLGADGVHFTDAGKRLQAEAMARWIREELRIAD